MPSRSFAGRWGWVGWALTVGSLAAGACGGKDEGPPPGTGTGNTGNTANAPGKGGSAGRASGGTGGKSGNGGTGGTSSGGMSGEMGTAATGDTGTGGAGETDALAPVVEIRSPEAESDPNGDGVLVDAEIDVVCRVTQSPEDGSRPVAPSTIVMQMLDADGNVVPTEEEGTVPGEVTDEENEYSAHFILNKVPDNGKVGFRCLAGDTSEPPLTGSDAITTLLDHGPTITRSEPKEDSPHALEAAVHVEFSVDPAPVAKGDEGASIASVELFVGGVTIEDVAENDGVYTADVHLSDEQLFPSPPNGDTAITIRAKNTRKPKAVTAIDGYSFIVDGDGPAITITEPSNGSVAGGLVTLRFDVVDDASGVDRDSVYVTLNGAKHYYDEAQGWSVVDDHYVYAFDSRLIENSVAQATINVRAKDKAGNDSPGASWLIYLDNVPPIVDLNPPNVRTYRKDGSGYLCSVTFDPLGTALGDNQNNVALLQADDNADRIRALVWEMTNDGADHIFSGTVENQVRIYVQPNTDEPLLVENNDGDPECDDVDEDAMNNLELIQLDPVAPTGIAYYGSDDADAAPPLSDFGCAHGTETIPPLRLCTDEASDLTTAIAHNSPGRPPAVYALGPLGGVFCTGRSYELGAHAQEGWVCLVGRAEDYAHNIGISAPLRVCYDDARTSFVPDCVNDMSNPPPCTDGCTPPAHFPMYPDDVFVRQ